MMKNKGQLWTEFMSGIMTLTIAAMIYTILDQIMTSHITPLVIKYGVDADNAAFFGTVWSIVLFFVVIAFVFNILTAARRGKEYGYV